MKFTVPAERYLKEALKDGYIPHKDDLFLIHGPGGVGKSSLISMFLGKQRDLTRVSTAVAEESIHLCPIRDVSTSTFTDKWELVDIDRQACMVAHTSHHLLSKTEKKDVAVLPLSQSTNGDKPQKQGREGGKANPFLKPKKSRSSQIASTFTTLLSKPLSKSLTHSLGDDPHNIGDIVESIRVGLHDRMRAARTFNDLMLHYSIRLLDSGGQPQFHEVVSIILQAVTGIVSVFKLSESLAVHGEVVFYKDGVQGNDPYKSYLTNEQVIRHDLLAIQSVASHSIIEEVPNIAFVGTFLDQQHRCPEETADKKDELLHSMITEILPEKLQECVISSGGSLHHTTFRVNARTPTAADYEIAKQLKDALMSQSRVKSRNLPLKWFGYEVALRKVMEKLNRQILSLQECEFIGHKLSFDPPSLIACLNYLRELHIISFYNVLPNVIFGSCQVILDKITELVTLSLELKKGKRALGGLERKFHQQGILSLDILHSETCSKHYSSKNFTPEDLLKVLKSLFIVTEVGPGEYLMPCVLEVSDIYPSPPVPKGNVRSSFVLHFSKKSPMLGIYCCTISYLLTVADWKLLSKGGEVVQVARNSITFQLPGSSSGRVTFRDPLSSYLEVVIDIPKVLTSTLSKKIRHEISNTFISAVKQAMRTLHYEVKTPELSFLCPEQSTECSELPHFATLDEPNGLLICSRNPGSVCHPLTPDQMMWLPKSECSRFFILFASSQQKIAIVGWQSSRLL